MIVPLVMLGWFVRLVVVVTSVIVPAVIAGSVVSVEAVCTDWTLDWPTSVKDHGTIVTLLAVPP